MVSEEKKEYLGDGVYVQLRNGALLLTTENGIAVQNEIVLEAEVFDELCQYVERLEAEKRADFAEAQSI